MKKFKFPLERVRDYRRLQMESEQARLEECAARVRSVERMESELQRQRLDAEQDLRSLEAANSIVPTSEAGAMQGYRSYTKKVGAILAQRRAEAVHQLSCQRAALLEARRKYEVLDRCRDQAQLRWTGDFHREQEMLAGELFLAKWGRDQRK